MEPIERRVVRYACPYCNRSRSKRDRIASHMIRCWRNAEARSCGSCEHHIPPSRGEPADYYTGYLGSPGEPRACDVDVDVSLEMPRGCPKWSPFPTPLPQGEG